MSHVGENLPTPPLPPTKIHLREVCEMTFCREGSKGSKSSKFSEVEGLLLAILIDFYGIIVDINNILQRESESLAINIYLG